MKIKKGDRLLVVVKGGVTLLMPKPKRYAPTLAGKGKGLYPKRYLSRERRSW
jgi:hypothetical protein